jgi:hypothetical protein
MAIEKLLRWAGIFLICVGIFAGTFGWATVDFKSYNQIKDIYDDLGDNPLGEAGFTAARTIFLSEISLVLSFLVGGIISGLVLMGIGRMIENQSDILEALNKKE